MTQGDLYNTHCDWSLGTLTVILTANAIAQLFLLYSTGQLDRTQCVQCIAYIKVMHNSYMLTIHSRTVYCHVIEVLILLVICHSVATYQQSAVPVLQFCLGKLPTSPTQLKSGPAPVAACHFVACHPVVYAEVSALPSKVELLFLHGGAEAEASPPCGGVEVLSLYGGAPSLYVERLSPLSHSALSPRLPLCFSALQIGFLAFKR